MSEFDKIVVIGGSAGALDALSVILRSLPKHYPYPILIVVHIPPDKKSLIADLLNEKSELEVRDANDKEDLKAGHAYFAPSDYHLMAERDFTVSLSVEEPVLYSRPSIDVLFETAADSYREKLVGVLLTGANSDGAKGLRAINRYKGICIVQDPKTAYAPTMPAAGAKLVKSAKILAPEAIAQYLKNLK